ncbi:MAG TPA: BTAD domain-containing putative transcriptional regulator [Kribbella sp.]|uniref:BTAD domain-containing putative transcriptional regulator n=1 Tax=Kribbella sp. TaxID=1871183 RepID=UPI002D77A5C0|nr:BTAD domain-containing putative transcriptional regulator [Kribbella sp.]HET6298478.1 BTAD domain-containing putative transcriptional regulator [Kribbella sp.]
MRPIKPGQPGGFRFSPPELNVDLIIRPRLLAVLQQRFRHRLTVLTAGPGFGKTSVLAQGWAENQLAPHGVDAWLTCNAGDSTASTLCAGLARSLQIAAPAAWNTELAISQLTAEIWRRSPEHVALLLDDAHLIAPGSPGAALLSTLVERMPHNGHVLLAGRGPLPVSSTRLAAMGQAVELGERDLAFSTTELAEFASARGLQPDLLSDTAGWPALAELAASVGRHRVRDYLWEELLTSMPPDRRRLLAMLALVGGGDEELASDLAGQPVDLTDLLAGLPLVAGVPGTWRSLHPLWWPALSGELEPDELTATCVTAATVLRARGDVDGAVRLLSQVGAWDVVHDVICETAIATHPLVAPDVFLEWYDLLPDEHRRAAAGRLLLALVERGADLPKALKMFEAVEKDFHDRGSRTGEIAAITHLSYLSWWLADADRLEAALGRAEALGREVPEFALRVNVGWAWLADLRGDWKGAFAHLGVFPDNWDSGVNMQRSWLLLLDGDTDRARRYAELAVKDAYGTSAMPAVDVRMLSTWLAGEVDEAVRQIPVLAGEARTAGRDPGVVFTLSNCAKLLAYVGDVAGARRFLEQARAALNDSNSALNETSFQLGEVAVLIAEGNEDKARALLADAHARRPLGRAAASRMHRLFPALSYVLVPESRPLWEATELHPDLAALRDIAAALVAAREKGSLREVAELAGLSPGQIRAALPLPWAVEFAVAAIAAGREEGRQLLTELNTAAGPHLKELTKSRRGALARTARELALRAPVVPSDQLDLLVLGPLELWRDGRPVDHPNLQRDRVRQLLLYMVAKRTVSRLAAAVELWPDLDADAAMRNLRVTLNYAQRLLEPDRASGEAPYFLRTENGMLRLTTEEPLSVDAWRFDKLFDKAEAAERQGAPSVALRAYEKALPLYRGDYLADVPNAEWAMVERDRLRVRYVLGAVRAGELLLATGDLDQSLRLAHAAMRADRLSESAHRLLVASHLERGEYDAARRTLVQCERVLDELGTFAGRETQIIARRIRERDSA